MADKPIIGLNDPKAIKRYAEFLARVATAPSLAEMIEKHPAQLLAAHCPAGFMVQENSDGTLQFVPRERLP